MSFTVRIDDIAQRDIDNFVAYQSEYSEAFAVEQIDRLYRVFNFHLAQAPMTWGNFFITGEPYHAYLFRVGRRTSYWIISPVIQGVSMTVQQCDLPPHPYQNYL